jgi:hypothetical protein
LDVEKRELTDFWSGGFNYYLEGHKYFKGHNGKITLDYMHIDKDSHRLGDQEAVTFQITVGF